MQTMYPGMPNSPQTELAADITADATTIPLLNAAALPPAPNLAVIGSDEMAETVLYTGIDGNNLTGVTRGFQGTARNWSAGAKVARNFTAYDYDSLRQNVEELDAGKASITHGSAHTEFGADPIPLATTTEGGLMSAADKQMLMSHEAKLDSFDYSYSAAASYYGVSPELGNNDATEALNNYFAALKQKGLKYAWFDKPHVYKVSGKLTEARDLILIGNAEIDSSLVDNYYIQICKTPALYKGRFNSIAGKNVFQRFSQAVNGAGNVKITVMGDSISTGGSDCLNISFNNTNAGQDADESSPSGITKGDAYFHRLIDMITTAFPNKTFDFYNRALGGTNIQEWNANKTFNSITKPWIDHVKDTACDLLIIAFGMNNNSFTTAKEFKYYLGQIIDYINANFNPVPSIALITTPRPVMSLEDTWGSAISQLSRDMAAFQARKYGWERGCYIIDVNKASNIKRCGKSFDNPYMKELAVTESQVDSIISGTFTKNGSEYVLQTDQQSLIFNTNIKDFTVEFDVKFSGFADTLEVLWFAFNEMSGINSNVILFRPKHASGFTSIELFTGFPDSAHFTTPKTWVSTSSWNDGVYRTVRIEKREDIVDVFVDNVRKIRGRFQINNLPGAIKIMKSSGSVGVITLKNIKIYKGEYAQYLPTLTEYEMWGQHVDGDTSTKPVIGGNGLNHPASIGLEETYVACLQEFVEDLVNRS